MGRAESPVRKTFFHRHLCCCYKYGMLDGKDFWDGLGEALCQQDSTHMWQNDELR